MDVKNALRIMKDISLFTPEPLNNWFWTQDSPTAVAKLRDLHMYDVVKSHFSSVLYYDFTDHIFMKSSYFFNNELK